MSEIFKIGKTALSPGITLIEASAGTGKTYAIAGMTVRLIAEEGMTINRILIVTFTEAATQELRDRVRSRIRDAANLIESGTFDQDEAVLPFAEASVEDRERAVRRLRQALLSFDEAAIFTIHGFCQRMLRENAFETGSLFDVELTTDAESLWREAAEDFWRRNFYRRGPAIGALVETLSAEGSLTIGGFLDLVRKLSCHPDLRILPEAADGELDGTCRDVAELFSRLQMRWREDGPTVASILEETDALSRDQRKGYPKDLIREFVADLDRFSVDTVSPTTVRALRRLSAGTLASSTVRRKPAPEHPFFALCAEFEQAVERFALAARRAFIEAYRGNLERTKERRNLMTFDDLLLRLRSALHGDGGAELAGAIGNRYGAALIDEFQDTDPVQWDIFHRVFGGGHHVMFLIGDPKQAIYSFRGADIFTYMAARREATRHFTLGTNWRSDRDLIAAANRIFTRHARPFVFDDIGFFEVEGASKKEELDLGASGLAKAPLRLICVGGNDAALNVDEARGQILRLVVREIRRLLCGQVRWKGRDLEAGDIAVLTRANYEAESVRQALSAVGIPAVVRTDQSVLQTSEAEHLLRLLAAVLEPHKNGLVKAALASPLFGYTARTLHELDATEEEWAVLAATLHEWQGLWARHGFMRMFRAFLSYSGLKARLLGRREGERIVTNYQHIAECLHAAEYEQKLTPSNLARWLLEQRTRNDGEGERHIIRLEKDDKAVQIVTIHRSKGLEYPIVFCPFNWSKERNAEILFHDRGNGDRLTWDLRQEPPDEHKIAAAREGLAESVRLLYVAVTRARNRCYLFWARTKDSENPVACAMAHVFNCGASDGPVDGSSAFGALVDGVSAEMEAVDGEEEEAIRAWEEEVAALQGARSSRRILGDARLVTSFSGLVAKEHDEAPDRDALRPVLFTPGEVEERASSIFAFPKGATAGNFFHALLENIDFTAPSTFAAATERYLAQYRFDLSFAPAITRMLETLVSLDLPGGVRLGDVSLKDRLVETAFYFPVQDLTATNVAKALRHAEVSSCFADTVEGLGFALEGGFMTGFVDLILRVKGRYFILDWKSNWLGPSADHYGRSALMKAMDENHYSLQYHIYAIALQRHLRTRLADYDYARHFGGVYYLFFRGLAKNELENGIFFDRPMPEVMDELESAFGGPKREVLV